MLNITNHQANSSQNHNEIPQKNKKTARMWREGKPPTLFVGMEIGRATKRNTVKVPQKLKKRNTI